jgi:hypothetical protein
MISHALQLNIFEQPSPIDFFNTLLGVIGWAAPTILSGGHSRALHFQRFNKVATVPLVHFSVKAHAVLAHDGLNLGDEQGRGAGLEAVAKADDRFARAGNDHMHIHL